MQLPYRKVTNHLIGQPGCNKGSSWLKGKVEGEVSRHLLLSLGKPPRESNLELSIPTLKIIDK